MCNLTHARRFWMMSCVATAGVVSVIQISVATAGAGGAIPVDEIRGQPVAKADDSAFPIRWGARLVTSTTIRTRPTIASPPRLRTDGFTPYTAVPEVLLVTGAFRESTGREWLRVVLAIRPNGASGWVPERDVQLVVLPLTIRVRLATRRLEVWRGGKMLRRFPVGIGKEATPTPQGNFAIEDKVITRRVDIPSYGPRILTITAHSNVLFAFNGGDGQIAIHGMGAGGRVGVAASHGCLVLGPDALAAVWRWIPRGTPVQITAR